MLGARRHLDRRVTGNEKTKSLDGKKEVSPFPYPVLSDPADGQGARCTAAEIGVWAWGWVCWGRTPGVKRPHPCPWQGLEAACPGTSSPSEALCPSVNKEVAYSRWTVRPWLRFNSDGRLKALWTSVFPHGNVCILVASCLRILRNFMSFSLQNALWTLERSY